MKNPETHNIGEQFSYGPASLLNAVGNSLSSPVFSITFTITGIYKRGKGVNYNGFYYDIIKDEFADANLTLLVPEALRHNLKEEQVIEALAYLSKRVSPATGRIDLILTVTNILSKKERIINGDEIKALELIQQKAKLGYKDVESLIKTKLYKQSPIQVTIIIGVTAIIDNDIKYQLKDAALIYNIRYVKVNLTRALEIIKALKENDGTDILVVSRGGGENIQMFDNLEISQQAINLQSALITAIGHASDEPLLQKVADKHFITPTALGQYFYDIYNKTIEEFNDSKAKLIDDLSKQIELNFHIQIKHLTTRLNDSASSMQKMEDESKMKVKLLSKRLEKSQSRNNVLFTLLLIAILVGIIYLMFN